MARKYDHEYKVQAVKLAKEIGGAKAAKELGIPEGTIHTWLKAVRAGTLDIGDGAHTPESAMSLAEDLLCQRWASSDNQETEILPISGTGCIGSDIFEVNLSTNIDNITVIDMDDWLIRAPIFHLCQISFQSIFRDTFCKIY